MEDNKQDVVPAPSTGEPSVTPEVTPQETETQEVETKEVETKVETPQAAPVRQTEVVEEYDEMGVPYKNRYMETQRKLQKLEETVTQLSQVQQQPAKQQYTAEELRAFAASTDEPQYRVWALNELDKITKQEQASIVQRELNNWKQQQEAVAIKQQVFNKVIANNPDVAIKDPQGNFVAWNTKSPLFNRISFYMNNPELANHPRGLEVAEAFAIRDLSLAQKPVTQQKITQQAQQLKSLQKKVLVEGSGNNAQAVSSPRQAAIERVKQTGSMKDAEQAMGSILRDSGLLKD